MKRTALPNASSKASVDHNTVVEYGKPPKPERHASAKELHVLRLAWRLQNNFDDRDYAAVCSALSADAQARAQTLGDSCPDGVAALAQDHIGPRPELAWVRLRVSWGSVVIRKRDGSMALSVVVHEKAGWRFSQLRVVGVDWP